MKAIASILAVLVLAAAATYAWYADLLPWPQDGKAGTQAAGQAMCAKHQIAEARCPWCDPSLIETLGHCGGHDVPEAFCSRCTPALIPGFKAENDWCAGHNLPESQCVLCNPELLAPADGPTTATSVDAAIELVRASDVPRFQRAPQVECQTNTLRIRFGSPEIAERAGFSYETVTKQEVSQTLICNAELAYDGSRYAHLAPRAPGVVQAVHADLGEQVPAGHVLATVDSAALGEAKADCLQAAAMVKLWDKSFAREQRLMSRGVATERQVIEAETKLTESRIALGRAKQRLRSLGMAGSAIEAVITTGDTLSLLPVVASFAGVVVQRSAVIGEVVDTKRALFSVADTSRMWALLDVQEADVPAVRTGQSVILEVQGLRGRRLSGTLTWISSQLNRRTRTLSARAIIDNPQRQLRAGMFGKAIVNVREREPALVVPKESVQWEGCCNIVFVRQEPTLFEPRKVTLSYATGNYYVVEDGLNEGEVVVSAGSFLLKTELLKGSIGAGCCEAGGPVDQAESQTNVGSE